jgi:hypothetical protein
VEWLTLFGEPFLFFPHFFVSKSEFVTCLKDRSPVVLLFALCYINFAIRNILD